MYTCIARLSFTYCTVYNMQLLYYHSTYTVYIVGHPNVLGECTPILLCVFFIVRKAYTYVYVTLKT